MIFNHAPEEAPWAKCSASFTFTSLLDDLGYFVLFLGSVAYLVNRSQTAGNVPMRRAKWACVLLDCSGHRPARAKPAHLVDWDA
jgi:hypothetical protein